MTYNAADALRAAGILDGPMSPELENFYSSLTKNEADTLISLKGRLEAVLPDAVAHSYTQPGVAEFSVETVPGCSCGLWSGSGSSK